MCHPETGKGFGFGHGHCGPRPHGLHGHRGPRPHGLHGHFGHRPHKMMHKFMHRWRKFMPYSLEATDTEYIIRTPLPGHDVKDVEVSVKKNHVLIETRASQEEEKKEDQPRKIRSFGEFLWNKPQVDLIVPLDDEIEPETVNAKLSKGILTVTVGRHPGTKIDVEE